MNRLSLSLLTVIFCCTALSLMLLFGTTAVPAFAQVAQGTPVPDQDDSVADDATSTDDTLVDSTALTATATLSSTTATTTTKAQLAAAIELYDSGDYTNALPLLQTLQNTFVEEADSQGEGVTWLYLGYLYQATDETAMARDALERSALIWEQLSDYVQLLQTLQSIGDLHYASENLEQAETSYRTALVLADELGDKEALSALTIQLNQIEFDRNFEQYQSDLEVARKASQGEKAASLLKKIGALYQGINELEQALATYEEELAFRRELEQVDKVADVLKAIGRIYSDQEQYTDAAIAYEEAASIWQELNETDKAASLYKDIGTVYRKAEEYDKAADAYNAEVDLRRLLDDAKGEAEAYHNVSEALLAAGTLEEAATALTTEIDVWLTLDESAKARDAQVKLAKLYATQEAVADAALQYTAAISLTRSLSDTKSLADLLTDLADLQVLDGEPESATDNYEEALAFWQQLDKPKDILKVHRRLADLYRKRELPKEAIAHLEQAIPLAQADNDEKTQAKLQEDLGANYRLAGNITKSIEAYDVALALWQELDDQASIMDTYKALGDIAYRETQAYDVASGHFAKAQAIAVTEGWTEDEAYFARRVGNSYDKQKDFENALVRYRRSIALWRELGNTEEAAKVAEDITKAEAGLAEQLLALRTENGLVDPADGATVSGMVDIRGLANDENFQKWQLDLLINQDTKRATFLNVSRRTAPSVKRLMTLDTTLYPNGTHTLRLRVVRTDFNYDEYTITLTIEN